MKFFNLEAETAENGEKVLNVTLYGDIDMGFFGDGVASAEIARMLAEHPDAKKITQRINSRGGDLFGGVAIYNALQNHGAEITSIVEGQAGSAASIAAMAGRTVMQRGSMLMIHNPAAPVFGDAGDHRAMADVLDKARDGLVAIYRAKTGKTAAELKKMLDAETWLTAEEAKREGFADEISDKAVKVKAEGDFVIVNEVSFPRAGVPAQILAMATATGPVEDLPKLYTAQDMANAIAKVRAAAPVAVLEEQALTRATLSAKAPDILAALLEEGRAAGHAAGIAEERARIKAIDELGLLGCEDMVIAAKFGEQPTDAPTLLMAAHKAAKLANLEMLEARRAESKEAAGVRQSAPTKTSEAAEMEAAKNIAAYANSRRGGNR